MTYYNYSCWMNSLWEVIQNRMVSDEGLKSFFFYLIEVVGTQKHLYFKFHISKDTHSKFSSGDTSSQVPYIIHFLVFKDLCYDISGGNSFGALSSHKFVQFFANGISIINVSSDVGHIIVTDIVDAHVIDKLWIFRMAPSEMIQGALGKT